MIQSNEPYQRVHSMEDSNSSTLGILAKHVGIGVASSAAYEGALYTSAKKINPEKHPGLHQLANIAAFNKDTSNSKFWNYANAGMSTGKGRVVNYGTTIAAGLLTGMLESSVRNASSSS